MSFIQTISFTSSKMDEMQQLMDDFGDQQLTGGDNHGFVKSQVLRDRDNPNAFMVVAEFDSYEHAMENSARPETDAFAKRMAELCDGPPTFGNYDMIKEETP